jgi:hypothetical protein
MISFRKEQVIDVNIEKRIITSFIVSDKITNELVPITNPSLFVTPIAKKVFLWIKTFQSTYKTAPKLHIEDIYNSHKLNLKPQDSEEISDFLKTISDEYSNSDLFNEEYLLEEGKKYLRKRHLLMLAGEIESLALADKIDEAESKLEKYGQFITSSSLSSWVKPFDDEKYLNSVFSNDEEDTLFTLGRALDYLVGNLRRNYFMLVMGPMKRGKTWGLIEIAMAALMCRRRTAFISLEMEDRRVAKRAYHGLGAYPHMDSDITYPVFDCAKNQINKCSLQQRTNSTTKPNKFDPNNKTYSACTACRGTKDFIPSTWFDSISKKAIDMKSVSGRIQEFGRHFGRNLFRLRSFPIGEANVQTIDRSLKMLEITENWVPEIIVIDYADILNPEDPGLRGRDKENEAFKALKGLSQKRKCLVASGTQGNRDSFDQDTLSEKNTSEDIRKLAHIDLSLTLNQSEEEKENGVTRIGVLNHRDQEAFRGRQAMVLQSFKVGKFHLDSEIIYHRTPKDKRG